jgi:hypothetical protein
MRHRGEQGILLLPVALTLAVIGTLAYTMTREGSMNVSAVDAQYEIERARYLAASGVQVAKWRVAKDQCNDGEEADFGALDLPGGRVSITGTTWKKGFLSVSVTATTDGEGGGAVQALTREMWVHNLGDPKLGTLIGDGNDDITIVRNAEVIDALDASLVATDNASHPLVYFKLPGELDNAMIVQADLKLTKEGSDSTQADRLLSVHRITRGWSHGSVSWTHPWTNAGGDYMATAAASVRIDPNPPGEFNGAYLFRITSLVQAWADDPPRNYGVLLKPTRLVNAKFTSFNGTQKPQLELRYYLRCT